MIFCCCVGSSLVMAYRLSCHVACGILVPWLGIEPVPPVTEAWSLNHWSMREVPPFSWLYNEESGAYLTPEVTANNCRWCPLGRGKHLSLQGEVLEQSVSVDHVTVAMKWWLNSPGSASLGRTAAALQERSPLHYLAVSGVFLFRMFDNFFLLVMLRVNFLLSSHQVITE